MTPKELLYLADALGMEQQLTIKCAEYANKVTDEQLKTLLNELSEKHQKHFGTLFQQLN